MSNKVYLGENEAQLIVETLKNDLDSLSINTQINANTLQISKSENLIPVPYLDDRSGATGLTITVGLDNSITIDGTASSNGYYGLTSYGETGHEIVLTKDALIQKVYKIGISTEELSGDDIYLYCWVSDTEGNSELWESNTKYYVTNSDFAEWLDEYFPNVETFSLDLDIQWESGAVFDNYKFMPLCEAYSSILPEMGGGHTIEAPSGTELTQRDTLQFTAPLTASDDTTNEKTVIGVNTTAQLDFSNLTPPSQAATGVSNLANLDDVAISSVTNGQVLTYNSSTSKWSNTNISSVGQTTLTQTLSVGSTSVTFTNLPTTGTHTYQLFTTMAGLDYDSVDNTTSGQLTYTFEAQESAVTCYLIIKEV